MLYNNQKFENQEEGDNMIDKFYTSHPYAFV